MANEPLPEEHGTHRGYQQHQKARTFACLPCVDGHRRFTWASRIRRGRSKGLIIPLAVLDDVLAGDTEALARFLGPLVVAAVEQWGDTRSVRPEVVAEVDATLARKSA